MTNPTTADLLKYADLQMAAEAFLVTDGVVKTGDALKTALTDGNNHTSRFTEVQATRFLAHWNVIAQKPNTGTGFSGTVFQCHTADPLTGAKVGEVVMSFRSTEFIDDSARDNAGTNVLEIKDTGFAWGQLRDMEDWYLELVRQAKLVPGQFAVTGYSLGGHLASAFNTLHPGAATQVVTFNGVGIRAANGERFLHAA